ncbi:Hypothetical protein, putative [Bodo saltans]|uniref:ADF-H domain-containing protein n=1 Tax=Bodo saltans TaxID=75058 RepID=A0A0S4JK07_BODSA|nr:Hypothetical protein, putative [Bodo saltans]|eukprot:CUG90277.1 Hypothetical protein, putative [Bodo saltans]
MASKFECVARGTESVDKAFPQLDEARVQFMYIKFPVGSGTFKRSKFVYVHFVGPKCGIVKRGKWNAEVGNILALFNAPSGVEVDDKNVLSFAYLVSQLKKVFVADDGSFSLQKIQEEYNRRIAEEAAKHSNAAAVVGGSEEPQSPVRHRKLAVELGLNTESVLKALREDLGPFNWATFEPNPSKLTLAEGGSGGIFELADTKLYLGSFAWLSGQADSAARSVCSSSGAATMWVPLQRGRRICYLQECLKPWRRIMPRFDSWAKVIWPHKRF